MSEQRIAATKLPEETHRRIEAARVIMSRNGAVKTSAAMRELIGRGLADFEREHDVKPGKGRAAK